MRVGVLEERSRAGRACVYRFAHAFFRQTLYEEMIAPRRLRLHQEVGTRPGSAVRRPTRGARGRAGRALRPVHRPCRPGQGGRIRRAGGATGDVRLRLRRGGSHLERCLARPGGPGPGRQGQALRSLLLSSSGEALIPQRGEPLASGGFGCRRGSSFWRTAPRASEIPLSLLAAIGTRRSWSHMEALPCFCSGTPSYRRWAERYDAQAKAGTRGPVSRPTSKSRTS